MSEQILGRGEVWFDPFVTGTETSTGEDYVGNTPAFSLSAETQELKHYNSDRGLREKDLTVTLQSDFSGSFTTDSISKENIARFFFGDASVLTKTQQTGQTDTLLNVTVGRTYQIGTSLTAPAGVRGVSAVTVTKDPAGVPVVLVAGTDYTVDLALGRVTLLTTGAAANGDTIAIGYTIDAGTENLVVSGSNVLYGALRFIAYNAVGANNNYYMPKVALRPNGEFSLKGDDWQAMSFNLEVLKKGTLANVYMNGNVL